MLAKDALRIDGQTRLMGVLGEQIAYTQSPKLHNRAANVLGQNIAYLPLGMPAAHVGPFLEAAWHLGAVGFNVTVPHKGLVASLVPGTRLTSVNTLYRGKRGWKAASTDGEGFAKGLARVGNELETFREIVVLGGGGAAQAIVRHALETTAAHVTVLRRGRKRDAALTSLTRKKSRLALSTLTPAALTKVLHGRGGDTLLVQATSAPSAGDDLAAFVPALASFQGVVSDLVYAKPSAIYFAALARDLVAQDGEAMLIEQARLSQMLWWGRCASYDEMAAALRNKE